VPELADLGAALDQEPGDVPASVPDRIVQRGADGPAGSFEVGPGVDERARDVGVVAAGRPVQGCLGLVSAGVCVGVGTCFDEQADGGGRVGE
jgi:hypothetical protein